MKSILSSLSTSSAMALYRSEAMLHFFCLIGRLVKFMFSRWDIKIGSMPGISAGIRRIHQHFPTKRKTIFGYLIQVGSNLNRMFFTFIILTGSSRDLPLVFRALWPVHHRCLVRRWCMHRRALSSKRRERSTTTPEPGHP